MAFDANKPLLLLDALHDAVTAGPSLICNNTVPLSRANKPLGKTASSILRSLHRMINSLRPSSLVSVANISGELSTGDFQLLDTPLVDRFRLICLLRRQNDGIKALQPRRIVGNLAAKTEHELGLVEDKRLLKLIRALSERSARRQRGKCYCG